MNCPYTDEELEMWDSVSNPMGDMCYKCEEFKCVHNFNPNNTEYGDEEVNDG